MNFTRALARLPGSNFADGLTHYAGASGPDFSLALEQHARYVEALQACGLAMRTLPADLSHPDGTFVEDTAVLTPSWAVLTIPGAPSRQGEVAAIATALARDFPQVQRITAPGTVDGGDICEAGRHFFIGLSHRTNAEGARQLARILEEHGCTSTVIDIRGSGSLLHLKTGMSYLGDDCLVTTDAVPEAPGFARFRRLRVDAREAYAANCVRVNDRVLVPRGYPRTSGALRELGFSPLELDMSEFEKMDGGLSCLSLRY